MSYLLRDRSVEDATPIELFKFIGTGGNHYYNDSDVAQTVINDDDEEELYLPLNIERGAIELTNVTTDNSTMDISVPVDCDLAQLFALRDSPDRLDVEVYRQHVGDAELELVWKGYTTGFSVSDRTATISTGNVIQTALQSLLNSVYYQLACNHVLYDARCKAVRADHTTYSTVAGISADEMQVTVEADGVENNDLRAGELIVDRTGERRFVMGNSADVISISHPFVDIEVSDSVTMVKGCVHNIGDCDGKFDNIPNYGGFPYIPTKNPLGG